MKRSLIASLSLSILCIAISNAASLKVLHNTLQSHQTLIDTNVQEFLMKEIKIGDNSYLYNFEVGKWSCDASFLRLFPEGAGIAMLSCGNHDGLVISSTGDAATYLEINDGRDLKSPVQRYEIRLVGNPKK